VIKFVSDLRQVGGFFLGTPISSNNKTDRQDVTEILADVVILDIELPFNVVTDAEIVENIAYDIAE
jgi:hypothetical protein